MNNSFESFLKNQKGINKISNNKNLPQSYYSSVMSNNSLSKNANTSKSNSKKDQLRRQELSTNRNNLTKSKQNPLKKGPAIVLTKRQKQIRQAIQYRFEKSKIKSYKVAHLLVSQDKSQLSSNISEDYFYQQADDKEEQESFRKLYGYLGELKIVNLYDYHKKIQVRSKPQNNDRSNGKIILIKNYKKKRQNSQSSIPFYHGKEVQKSIQDDSIGNAYFFNSINANNTSLNTHLKSQRYHTSTSQNQHQPSQKSFKLQFLNPSSKDKGLKPKSNSKDKMFKVEHSQQYQSLKGMRDKKSKPLSSSVDKSFKSIKQIYMNALNNLVTKSTVKPSKLLQGQLKGSSRNILYDSEKKSVKNSSFYGKGHESAVDIRYTNNNNYLCTSSRDNNGNKQVKKINQAINKGKNKEKLQKTVLINDTNSTTQWKSIMMRIEDEPGKSVWDQSQSKQPRLRIKTDNMGSAQLLGHPHSHRQYTKSPKLKKFEEWPGSTRQRQKGSKAGQDQPKKRKS